MCLDLTLLNTFYDSTRGEVTRPLSNSVLDLCFANSVAMTDDMIESFVIGETLFADHYSLSIRLRPPPAARAEPEPVNPVWRIHSNEEQWQRDLPRVTHEAFEDDDTLQRRLIDLESAAHRSPSQAQRLVQHCWQLFLSRLTAAMRTCIRYAPRTSMDDPCFRDPAVRDQFSRVQHARSRLRRRRRSRNLQLYPRPVPRAAGSVQIDGH